MINCIKPRSWEINQSSLRKIVNYIPTYEECKNYACRDIVENLTNIPKSDFPFVVELDQNSDFHFIGRIDTCDYEDNPFSYYNSFKYRDFISFSTISNKNISHYKGKTFFIYNILPEDIVHIFPVDSNTIRYAKNVYELTAFPSLWLTLEELESLTDKLGVYNQITCKTKRNGEIIKPFAVVAFNHIDENIKKVAKKFGIGIVLVHPNSDAINYRRDLMYDNTKLSSVSSDMKNLYGIDVGSVYYFNYY